MHRSCRCRGHLPDNSSMHHRHVACLVCPLTHLRSHFSQDRPHLLEDDFVLQSPIHRRALVMFVTKPCAVRRKRLGEWVFDENLMADSEATVNTRLSVSNVRPSFTKSRFVFAGAECQRRPHCTTRGTSMSYFNLHARASSTKFQKPTHGSAVESFYIS